MFKIGDKLIIESICKNFIEIGIIKSISIHEFDSIETREDKIIPVLKIILDVEWCNEFVYLHNSKLSQFRIPTTH